MYIIITCIRLASFPVMFVSRTGTVAHQAPWVEDRGRELSVEAVITLRILKKGFQF